MPPKLVLMLRSIRLSILAPRARRIQGRRFVFSLVMVEVAMVGSTAALVRAIVLVQQMGQSARPRASAPFASRISLGAPALQLGDVRKTTPRATVHGAFAEDPEAHRVTRAIAMCSAPRGFAACFIRIFRWKAVRVCLKALARLRRRVSCRASAIQVRRLAAKLFDVLVSPHAQWVQTHVVPGQYAGLETATSFVADLPTVRA